MPDIELHTRRLLMRRYTEDDIPALVEGLGSKEVAATTLRVVHPYTEEDARKFLREQNSPAARFGMFDVETGKLVGGIGLRPEEAHDRAELGYWVAVPYWGRGYASEAVAEMLRHGFEDLKLNRITAAVFEGNPASEKVLQKNGFVLEGVLRQHYKKWGKYLDDRTYGLLASDWKAQHL